MVLTVYSRGVGVDSVRKFLVIGKKGKGVPIHAMKELRWKGGMAPLILNLGTRWGELSD